MKLVERATNILRRPRQEWRVIAAETTGTQDLYRDYIAPLAAIGPAASIFGMSVVGVSVPVLGTYRLPFTSAVGQALAVYMLTLASVFVLALVIDGLAPSFSGTKNGLRALRVAAYAGTPGWLAGVFNLIPALEILGIVASLYGLYLLYVGLPELMEVPEEKAAGYTATVAACAIVLFLVVGAVGGSFVPMSGPGRLTGQ